MASWNRRRHRTGRLPFGGPPTQPSFHQAVCAGGGDYSEWPDLRLKLQFTRNQQEPSPHRPADSYETQPGSSKTLRVHGLEEPREPEIQVPTVRKGARITSEEESENKQNDTTEHETVRQVNTDEEQHGAVGKVWHSSVMTHPCNDLAMGKTIESNQPPQMRHELLFTKDDLHGRPSLAKAPGFCDSEEQQTPLMNTAVARKRLFKSEDGSLGAVSDSEEEELFYRHNTDELTRDLYSMIRIDDAPDSVNVKQQTCHDDPELSNAAKRPRLDAITGLKKEQLERQMKITEPQDKHEYCARWLQWDVVRAEAEEIDSEYHNDQDSPSPKRRRRSRQAMVSDYRYDQCHIDHKISADAESSNSEHKPIRQKLQSSEEDKLPDYSCALPQHRPSSECQSEDQRIIQELLERFKELYKPG